MNDYEEILENIERSKETSLVKWSKIIFNLCYLILLFWALFTLGGNK
jgi:hypothetical protein